MVLRNLPLLSNTEDAADQIGIGHVRVALGHVDVAVGRRSATTSVGSVSASGFPDARFAQRHQHLAVWTELDDDAAFLVFSGELLEVVRTWRESVTHTFPSPSTWMPCGQTNIPAPKLLISFPDSSK
jgi:hypothetical protein